MNPRYVAYAVLSGKTVEQALADDEVQYPGGRMCGYILWIGAQWERFYRLNGWRWDHLKSLEDHDRFDAWLATQAWQVS